jgi:hypothetical protein
MLGPTGHKCIEPEINSVVWSQLGSLLSFGEEGTLVVIAVSSCPSAVDVLQNNDG